MRKILLILLCISLLLGNVFAASDEITDMSARITVDSNGTCRVTVTAEVRFATGPTTFEFPLGTDAKDISASGASYRTKTRDGVKCILFENETGFQGTQTFQCSYSLPCTMWESGDKKQHFTAKLPERGMEYPIRRYDLTVEFPADISAFPRWHSSYYGDVIDNYMSIQVKEHTVTARSNILFRDHETLSMTLTFPPDAFALNHLAKQTVDADRLIFFLLFAVCILYWLIALRKSRVTVDDDIRYHFESSAGEVPCQLYSTKADLGGLIALWGGLGYILLYRNKRGVFRLEKRMPMGNERSTAERRLFRSIFHNRTSVEVGGYRFMSAVNTEGSVLTAQWKRRMFEKKDGNPKLLRRLCLCAGLMLSLMIFDTLLASTPARWFWLIVLTAVSLPLHWTLQQVFPHLYRPDRWIYLGLGAGAALILVLLALPAQCGIYLFFNLLLQLGAGYVTRFGGQRTLPGRELVQKLLRLRYFVLRSDPRSAEERVRDDSQYFYRIFPYAEIMGVGSRFHKIFAPVTKESCPWFIDERTSTATPTGFYKAYTELVKLLRTESSMSFLRSLHRDFYVPLPRVRPGTSGSGQRGPGHRSTGHRGSGRTASPRSNAYRTNARRPAPHLRERSREPVHAGRHPTRKTQHRANPNHRGRRS